MPDWLQVLALRQLKPSYCHVILYLSLLLIKLSISQNSFSHLSMLQNLCQNHLNDLEYKSKFADYESSVEYPRSLFYVQKHCEELFTFCYNIGIKRHHSQIYTIRSIKSKSKLSKIKIISVRVRSC